MLEFARKWWRPVGFWAASITIIVNGIVVPLWTKTAVTGPDIAAMFAGFGGLAGVRAYEKIKGCQ